jgi:hypothetical protein
MITSFAGRRAARLISLHTEINSLLRTIAEQRQADLFEPTRQHLRTADAVMAANTIRLSAREANDLVRATLPPSAHDATTRIEHALLFVALRHCMDTVRQIDSDTIPPAAIAAAQILREQLTTWLQVNNVVTVKRHDKASADLADRPREPKRRISRRRLRRGDITVLLGQPASAGPGLFQPESDTAPSEPAATVAA